MVMVPKTETEWLFLWIKTANKATRYFHKTLQQLDISSVDPEVTRFNCLYLRVTLYYFEKCSNQSCIVISAQYQKTQRKICTILKDVQVSVVG
jgi:hypothetical protein